MQATGGKENRFMKKKTSKKLKTQSRYIGTKSGIKDKFKSSTLKAVKESSVVYNSNNNNKRLQYTDKKIGKIEIIKDFLPAPEELALKDLTVKVTLNLSKYSIDFFKALAEKNGSQYQKVIRNLLDRYAQNFTGQL